VNLSRVPILLSLLFSGCVSLPPTAVPQEPDYVVAVESVRIPTTEPWVSRFAYHTWFDLKRGAENNWERVEILSAESGVNIYHIPPADARGRTRWDNPVEVVGLVTGEAAREMIPGLEERARNYPDRAAYTAWPGPNSNSFITYLARATPGLKLQFNHNAVGRDYTPWFYAGRSVSGSGVQLDTWLLGLQAGWREGIQVHFLQLTFGISLFPPALELPILPRIGLPPARP